MDINDFKELSHTNYRHILEKHTGFKWKKDVLRKVEAFFEAFSQLYIEKQGGVYLKDFGYFCHIKSPKRIYNKKGILYRPEFPYLFTELNAKNSKIKNWSMEGSFHDRFNYKEPKTMHYSTIKQYIKK